jgi:hypothetical protein
MEQLRQERLKQEAREEAQREIEEEKLHEHLTISKDYTLGQKSSSPQSSGSISIAEEKRSDSNN